MGILLAFPTPYDVSRILFLTSGEDTEKKRGIDVPSVVRMLMHVHSNRGITTEKGEFKFCKSSLKLYKFLTFLFVVVV